MKAFIDTSTLIKKYVQEEGSDRLDDELKQISEIIVAPLYWIELNSALHRRLRERTLTEQETDWIIHESKRDYQYFARVIWNDTLEEKAVKLIRKYRLKTLDSVQLSSGILSGANVFLTSDQNLFKVAKKEFKDTLLIGDGSDS